MFCTWDIISENQNNVQKMLHLNGKIDQINY
jgi:hypothetical protein